MIHTNFHSIFELESFTYFEILYSICHRFVCSFRKSAGRQNKNNVTIFAISHFCYLDSRLFVRDIFFPWMMEVNVDATSMPLIDAHLNLLDKSNPNSPDIRKSSNELVVFLKVSFKLSTFNVESTWEMPESIRFG